jgi:FkbM family methyltransferase
MNYAIVHGIFIKNNLIKKIITRIIIMANKILSRVVRGLNITANLFQYIKLEYYRLFGISGCFLIYLKTRKGIKFPVWIRKKTTDYSTLISCFEHGYHRPLLKLKKKSVILDLGSNVGYTIIDFRNEWPDSKIYGVEMDRENFKLCKNNISNIKNVNVINCAVWHRNAKLKYNKDDNEDAYKISNSPNKKYRTIKAMNLASLILHWGLKEIDYIKMDIEGAEKEIFELGNLSWLRKVKQISIELHGTISQDKIIGILKSAGMKTRIDSRHWSTIIGYRN